MESNVNIISAGQKLTQIDPSLEGKTITIKSINKNGEFDKKKDENGNLTNEDKVFSYTIKDGDTLQDVINKINADSDVSVFFDENSKQFSITANNTGVPKNGEAAIQLGGDGKSLFTSVMKLNESSLIPIDKKKKISDLGVDTTSPTTIKVGNEIYTLNYEEDDTLETVMEKINSESRVNISFNEDTQQFSIIKKDKDETGSIELNGDFFTNFMKMNTDGSLNQGLISKDTAGQNAKLTYNGLEIERPSNSFIINGARLTVKETTNKPVTYSSTPDVDSIFEKIKEFVDTYNGLISNISEEISQKKNKSYDPLTKAEKEALSEDEIEKWDKIARDGTLYRDPNLSSLLTKMRTSIYTSVKGTNFDNMAKIGIATTSNYLDGGKLEIDETKLRAAINEDPNGIYELFMGGKDDSPTSEQGLVRRLRSDLYTAMETITEKAGKTNSVNNTFTLGKLLDDYEDKISAFEEKLLNLEDRYYRQFTAMEKAISQANSQSAMLMNYFAN